MSIHISTFRKMCIFFMVYTLLLTSIYIYYTLLLLSLFSACNLYCANGGTLDRPNCECNCAGSFHNWAGPIVNATVPGAFLGLSVKVRMQNQTFIFRAFTCLHIVLVTVEAVCSYIVYIVPFTKRP